MPLDAEGTARPRARMKVGIVVPMAEEDDGSIAGWPALRGVARAAEESGLDAVWTFDHLLFRFPDQPTRGIWECWTVVAALAEATERVELGTLVLAAPFRNPAVLAKMADTLLEISRGRLILGLGTGWHEPEFEAFGLPADHRYGRFEEAFAITAGLLRDGRADVRGRFHSTADAVLAPHRSARGRPPILVAARGPRMLRLTARHADLWNAAWFGRPTRYVQRRDELLAACAEVGRDPGTLLQTAGVVLRFDEGSDGADDPDRSVDGRSGDAIVETLGAYAELDVGHLICSLDPATPETVERVARAVETFRRTDL